MVVVARDLGTLVAPDGPPVRRTQMVAPVHITTSPSGRTLVDFGQNLVGRLRITVHGEAGTTVTLRHAEVLENGELGVRPLRTAQAIDRYTLKGGEPESWEPRFTFHGFRYAQVDGWPGDLAGEHISAAVCHSDLERSGWFESSDPLLNRLHENVVWSMRGNFFDIPTDCPQRDERLGWTGDIAAFAPTATFLFECAGFLSSWLADLAAEQQDARGIVPVTVPDVIDRSILPQGAGGPVAAWGDAAVIVPWVLYQRFGDSGILAAQYESMRAWVDFVKQVAGEKRVWDQGFQLGDWLDPAAPPNAPSRGRTDRYLVATAYFARSAELVGQAAGVLGRSEDAARYLQLAAEVREAFARAYVTPDGPMTSHAETAYSLAIEFALLTTEEQRQQAGRRLAELVRENGYHIATGFVGTPIICDALCRVGHVDAAFRLLLQRECPILAVPGDDGRHHHLGTLGQHASRRHDQPWRDDLLQPLCPGRCRRLASPLGGRVGSGRPRLSRAGAATATRWRSEPRPREAPHAVRYGRMFMADGRWTHRGRSSRAGQHDGERDPARQDRGAYTGGVGHAQLVVPLRL